MAVGLVGEKGADRCESKGFVHVASMGLIEAGERLNAVESPRPAFILSPEMHFRSFCYLLLTSQPLIARYWQVICIPRSHRLEPVGTRLVETQTCGLSTFISCFRQKGNSIEEFVFMYPDVSA